MATRKWFTSRALVSYRALGKVVDGLTLDETTACLDLEAATRRRRSVIDRLIKRAVRLSLIEIETRLQEKYHGKSTQQDHDHRREEGRPGQPQDRPVGA